jgi:hypothetical protein
MPGCVSRTSEGSSVRNGRYPAAAQTLDFAPDPVARAVAAGIGAAAALGQPEPSVDRDQGRLPALDRRQNRLVRANDSKICEAMRRIQNRTTGWITRP